MGPMGPMGPMMDGGSWSNGTAVWLVLGLAILIMLALAVVTGFAWGGRGPARQQRPQTPEELLRGRYARGEINRPKYREALVDVLKDRYVRGELEIDDYEARLRDLLEEPPERMTDRRADGLAGTRPGGG